MKLSLIIVGLVVAVLLCEKFEKSLPPPISWLFTGWKKFSHCLGIVMSTIILTLLWVFGFGVYAVIIKIITFPKRFASEPNSYWIAVEPSTKESMQHQF